MARETNFSKVLSGFPQEVRDKYDFSNARYVRYGLKIENIVCPEHGVFGQYAGNLKRPGGAWCQECGSQRRQESVDRRRITPESFVARCQEQHGDKYDYGVTKFEDINGSVMIGCRVHGPVPIKALKHLYAGQGCGLCEREAKKARIVQFRHLSAGSKKTNFGARYFDRCRVTHGSERYDYVASVYNGARQPITVRCKTHGEFTLTAHKHVMGAGCPGCSHHLSQFETKVSEWLTEIGVPFDKRNRKILAPKEIDIWMPQHALGIEVHGLYWHTEDKIGNVHAVKHEMAENAGIRLVQIFEDDIVERWPAVKDRLMALLGLHEKVFARKTSVGMITSVEARDFLNLHHMQGAGHLAGIYYGLKDADGVLIAVMTFGQMRRGSFVAAPNPGQFELLRFSACRAVVGGFSKLLAAFVNDHAPEKIVSYSDMMHSSGGVYARNGFQHTATSRGQYWWLPPGTSGRKRVSRYVMQKHKLKDHPTVGKFYDPMKSEDEICRAAGWLKILGVGNQRWELDLNKE